MKEILYQLVYVYVNEPSRNRRFSSALQPEDKKCKNANEDAADFEPPNEHQSKFDAQTSFLGRHFAPLQGTM